MAAASSPQFVRLLLTVVMTGLALVAVVVNALPVVHVAGVRLMPSVPLILLFYWAVYRPEIFPRWLAFLMGLGQDVLSGGPIGLWALVYVCVYEGVYANRVFFTGRAAYSSLIGFAFAAAAAGALAWIVVSLYHWQLMTPMPVIGQTAVTIVLYPVLARILSILDGVAGVET